MLRVGLTGGIASGKSLISSLFSELDVKVIDTDIISHQLMQTGEPAYLAAVQHFGPEILNPDKTINRAKLRQIVFDQPEEKQWLEKMIHPLIRKTALDAMREAQDDAYAIMVVPLMFESGFDQLLDHIVVIDCPPHIQKHRLMQRDGIDAGLADKMIAAQMSNAERLSKADSIIANKNEHDRSQDVSILDRKLREIAHSFDN